ncbi:hypothetical protein [Granulicatella seriolae]|uniref:Uncharacterized protein n=1 Tax=Granulicatella seriolae TaxID=2967226 RepID=A0ABT1WQB4_9LACT|nr:hypothetical protein [Granulicatella seriolae]
MLPYEKEVQKAIKNYLLIINISSALILISALLISMAFFAFNQISIPSVNPLISSGSPIYAFLTVAIPTTMTYILLRVVIKNYGENLRQSHMMANTRAKQE